MKLDLGSLESVREFAKEFNNKFSELNILINNAGVYCDLKKQMKTSDGLEVNFGVNHLGHFLLTNLLLEKIKKAAPSRYNNES
jgi:NAD(P)-dependent dehydrogenase (short-subunit alcohol dehydrogenase family)